MIRENHGCYILETNRTTYCFRVTETGHLEHLYYGRKLCLAENGTEALREPHAFPPGNANVYDDGHTNFSLEDMRLEMSSYGKGDVREPFVEAVHADGSITSDFLFESAERGDREDASGLPHAYDETGPAEGLCVTLRDRQYDLTLKLYYRIFAECDVITRSAALINTGKTPVQVKRLMSAQVDFDEPGYTFTTFSGAWGREMKRTDIPLFAGKHVNASYTGTSSGHANPFVMLAEPGVTEDFGSCYGFNLIYSGNHYEAAEVSGYGKTRFVTGINPQSFSWHLAPGESFAAPEAVLAYSCEGRNGLSQCMHRFVREHIVRGVWKHKDRPVLLNSWEAAYFDIDEEKLVQLAEAARDVGAELLVMDDGWFGERDDDLRSLGDWEANTRKLPHGLDGLCRKIRALGLDFGIWVEPEMVNVDSNLYRAHPDWALAIPGRPHSEGRHQRVLDLTRPEVQDYIIEAMTRVFSSTDISYVKWDMNRIFSDVYSAALPAEQQGEVAHRYVLGLYRCLDELTRRFPEILFEGCSAGGNRFDLGILSYCPQIWASDNTDALCRAEMQNNYSYGYPLSTVGAHVSACPNHQTLRNTPLETRFQVAAFGVCGYECNLCEMTPEERTTIREQITFYKKWRPVLQWGDFYRGRSFRSGEGGSVLMQLPEDLLEWTCAAPDGSRAVGFVMQKLTVPNIQYACYHARGLDAARSYHFTSRAVRQELESLGSLVRRAKRDCKNPKALDDRFIRLDGETEDCRAGGDVLMYGGVRLKPAYAATGYSGEVRFFPDFSSRMYLMEAEE